MLKPTKGNINETKSHMASKKPIQDWRGEKKLDDLSNAASVKKLRAALNHGGPFQPHGIAA